MNYAVIDTESLRNPLLVNKFKQLRVVVEHEETSEANEFHHVFFLELADEEILGFHNLLSETMKKGWFAFLWNESELKVVFCDRSFSLALPSWQDASYKRVVEYAKMQGIQDEFLGIDHYFRRYEKLINDYKLLGKNL